MKTTRFILFTLLALSLAMFVACNNEPASSGSGSVTCILNGIIYDAETLTPIKGASVSNGTQSTQTDKNGSFALENVAPGSYTISIVKDGYVMEVIEDVLVDSGRFYNRELSDEDKAMLAKLISEGADIDDYYAEILFGGERDAEGRNPDIDSIGDSATYGQTIFAVGLTPANAVLEGTIDVVFEDKSAYDVPEGVGIIAICVNQPVANNQQPEIIRTYRTTVGKAGSFRFEKIMPGFYYLAVEPMSITLNEVTIEVDGYLFNGEGEGVIVLNGSGTTNTLHVPAPEEIIEDPFKLKVLSIKAVDRSELPIGDGTRRHDYDVSMKAGQAICIEFNKPIDENADGTSFIFNSGDTQITGYTKYLIVNGDDGHGYAYVWHDSIQKDVRDLRIAYRVTSSDKDNLSGNISVGYAYQLKITETNLYEYDYDSKIVDGVFMADQTIVVTFDKEIPENSSVEGVLELHNLGQSRTIPVNYEYDGNLLYANAPLEYREHDLNEVYYTLMFKITTDEGIVIYNTENGLSEPADRNILKVIDNDRIRFSTADALVCNNPILRGMYGPALLRFNHSIENDLVHAYIYRNEETRPVDLVCEIDEDILKLSLPEDTALLPGMIYFCHIFIGSEQGAVLYSHDQEFYIPEIMAHFDTDFTNGLDDFEVVGEDYDWDTTTASFSWTSLGINLDQQKVYQLWVRTVGNTAGDWILKGTFDEISSFDYTYRDKEIEITDLADAVPPHALLYTHKVEYILTSYDEDGLMIQSPVRTIQDMVGPKMTSAKPYITPGTTSYAYLNEHPVIFTLDTNEPIDSVKEEDVVVGGAHPEYFEVTWKMVDADSAGFTVKAVNAPVQATYAEGDLELTITLRDTSYNETEQVLDFKGQDL